MANMDLDIRTGIYNRLTVSASAFRNAIAASANGTTYYKFYDEEAPQQYPNTSTDVVPPYVVMDILPITQVRDSATQIEMCSVAFSIFAYDKITTGMIAGYLMDLLENAEPFITIGSFKILKIQKEFQMRMPKVEMVYHLIVQYQLTIQH